MAGMVNDDQAAQVGTSPSDHSNKEQNSPLDQQEQTLSCEEGGCCISESVTQEKSESGQTPNITQALAATPVHTQKVALELCWYCLKSQPTEDLNIHQLQVDSEDLTLPPSGERLNYQRDPRPHFGVAHSSRSVSFPLWDSDRPREMKRGEEKEETMDSVSCCPHCHLGLPRDTLRWHELNCHRMELIGLWNIKGSEGSMLPSKIYQMKVAQETGREANIGFERALIPSYLGMHPPKLIG